LHIDEPNYGDAVLKILLNAGTSPKLEIAYDLYFNLFSNIYVKTAMTRGQSAEVLRRSITTSEASQRLHAEDLIYAYIVGLFEGDGYFSITKKGIYLTYEIGIELSIKDVQLIYKIKNLLSVGKVNFRKRDEIEMVSLRIRNKDHLIKYILPIFDKYPMFSNKQYDYLRFRNCLLSNIIKYEDLPKYIRDTDSLNTIDSIISSHYFSSWLIGFIEAEGCFSFYKLKKDSEYMMASFDISQKDGDIIISAIKKYLSFTTSIHIDKTNCYKLKVAGVRSIENVIKFIQKAPVKLIGNKKLNYLLWLKQLRTIERYSKKIKIPSTY